MARVTGTRFKELRRWLGDDGHWWLLRSDGWVLRGEGKPIRWKLKQRVLVDPMMAATGGLGLLPGLPGMHAAGACPYCRRPLEAAPVGSQVVAEKPPISPERRKQLAANLRRANVVKARLRAELAEAHAPRKRGK